MIKLQPEHNPYAASRAGTVGDLIEILKDYDPDKIVISTNPPFDHVNIEPQIDGTILISS